MSEYLKPCHNPFTDAYCIFPPEMMTVEWCGEQMRYLKCDCGIKGPVGETIEQAIEAWNTRAETRPTHSDKGEKFEILRRHIPDPVACAYCGESCGGSGPDAVFAPSTDEEDYCCSIECALTWAKKNCKTCLGTGKKQTYHDGRLDMHACDKCDPCPDCQPSDKLEGDPISLADWAVKHSPEATPMECLEAHIFMLQAKNDLLEAQLKSEKS